MGSLPHLYFPSNPIQDSDIDRLLDIENEGLQSWKRVKKSGELEIYTRKAPERGSPPISKVRWRPTPAFEAVRVATVSSVKQFLIMRNVWAVS